MFNYKGSIHIHSVYSDGTGTIPEIAAAANAAGLDFIIITDHNERVNIDEEGFYGKTAVLMETELNSGANHYLAMGTKTKIPDYTETPQKTIDAVKKQGGFGFLAHPFETGSPLITDGSAFPWNDWNIKDFDGLELWNYCSQWRGKALAYHKIIFWYLFDLHRPAKNGAPPLCLEAWDRFTLERPVVAIGGTDNHAVDVKFGPFKAVVFPYETMFRTVNTHILLPERMSTDFQEAKKQIFEALRKGNCFISFDIYRGDGDFYFGAFNENGEVPMGSEISFLPETYLRIKACGKRSLVRIIKDGELIFSARESHLLYPLEEEGVYRAEIYYCPPVGKPRPWIYSNPVYVKG